jgi:uncharacterized protein
VRIEVAKTLEGAIPDLAAKRIIDEAITPNFARATMPVDCRRRSIRLASRINSEALPLRPMPQTIPIIQDGFNWMNNGDFGLLRCRLINGRRAPSLAHVGKAITAFMGSGLCLA